jgi:glyoxylase-like metal-dependent hydrolase (beta-lactamase superfamily II)
VGDIYEIATNLYVVPRGGGNTAVFVTGNGVLLVDTKYAERGLALLEQVRKVTDKPVTHVVNTHCHADHTGGNRVMPPTADIIVQERTAANMAKMGRNDTASGPLRPLHTFRDHLTLFAGEDEVDLYYFGAAHTDGDALVVFRSAGVMHAGDVFIDKTAPVINLPWGGSPATYGATIEKAGAAVTNCARVITGHGPVFSWRDFLDYGEFNQLILAHVRKAMHDGKDWNRARTELALPPKFTDYRLDRLIFTFHDIYKGLTPWWHFW